jgi:CTP synthase
MPDILITRSEAGLDEPRLETLAKRCFLDSDAIFDDRDCESIYDVPLLLEKQGLVKKIKKHFKIKKHETNLKDWKKIFQTVLKNL